ncbi:MAG: hypothetical protein ACFB9M_11725 [Myxococcota bacterium]
MSAPPRLPDWDRAIDRLKSPLAIAAAVRFGVLVGQEASKLRRKEISLPQFRIRVSQHIGGLTGTAAGAAAGAWAGSFVPGVGTLLGAFGGALAGELAGESMTRWSVGKLGEGLLPTDPPQGTPDHEAGSSRAGDAVGASSPEPEPAPDQGERL